MRSSPTTADAREDADLPADNAGQASPPSCGILRSPRDTLHFARSTEYFPLTLTLSLREREQQASDWCLADGRWANSGRGLIERLWTILPLPKGEGRGEGERTVVQPTVPSVNERGFRSADLLSAVSQIFNLLAPGRSASDSIPTPHRKPPPCRLQVGGTADCPSPLCFDATAPKPEAKAGKSALRVRICGLCCRLLCKTEGRDNEGMGR